MNSLRHLITKAVALGGENLCAEAHDWVSEGGRECPKGYDDCSQTVYMCARCGQYDFGNHGGPAWNECYVMCNREDNYDAEHT